MFEKREIICRVLESKECTDVRKLQKENQEKVEIMSEERDELEQVKNSDNLGRLQRILRPQEG